MGSCQRFLKILLIPFQVAVLDYTEWESGEKSIYNIPYIDSEGIERSYFVDFVVERKLIEVKPENLRNSKNVLLKEEAAKKWCLEHDFEYEIITQIDRLSDEKIAQLHNSGLLKFIDRYEEKYKKLLEKL